MAGRRGVAGVAIAARTRSAVPRPLLDVVLLSSGPAEERLLPVCLQSRTITGRGTSQHNSVLSISPTVKQKASKAILALNFVLTVATHTSPPVLHIFLHNTPKPFNCVRTHTSLRKKSSLVLHRPVPVKMLQSVLQYVQLVSPNATPSLQRA